MEKTNETLTVRIDKCSDANYYKTQIGELMEVSIDEYYPSYWYCPKIGLHILKSDCTVIPPTQDTAQSDYRWEVLKWTKAILFTNDKDEWYELMEFLCFERDIIEPITDEILCPTVGEPVCIFGQGKYLDKYTAESYTIIPASDFISQNQPDGKEQGEKLIQGHTKQYWEDRLNNAKDFLKNSTDDYICELTRADINDYKKVIAAFSPAISDLHVDKEAMEIAESWLGGGQRYDGVTESTLNEWKNAFAFDISTLCRKREREAAMRFAEWADASPWKYIRDEKRWINTARGESKWMTTTELYDGPYTDYVSKNQKG